MPEEKWVRHNANCQNVQTESFTVDGLEEGAQYKFRIFAKTAINQSQPSEESDAIAVIAEHGKNYCPCYTLYSHIFFYVHKVVIDGIHF